MKQQKLFYDKTKKYFGGSLLKNSNPKTKRPFSSKAPMHIVLKARFYCLRDQRVKKRIEKYARKNFIKVYQLQIMSNHIHLVLRSKNKDNLNSFLRIICGLIPRLLNKTRIWLYRPFSRIISWGKDYQGIKDYIKINSLQAQGFSKQEARLQLKRPHLFKRQTLI